jgi:hypothetical protein
MAELNQEGYQAIRDYVVSSASTPNSWGYIELYDDTSSAITRINIVSNDRCGWSDIDGDNVLKIELTLSGGDSDITTPVTVSESAIWTQSSGGIMVTQKESFAEATLSEDGDTVNITHTIKLPQ